jgi:hypothetical protein
MRFDPRSLGAKGGERKGTAAVASWTRGEARADRRAMFGMWRSNGAGVVQCRFAAMPGVPGVATLLGRVPGRSTAAAIARPVAR